MSKSYIRHDEHSNFHGIILKTHTMNCSLHGESRRNRCRTANAVVVLTAGPDKLRGNNAKSSILSYMHVVHRVDFLIVREGV